MIELWTLIFIVSVTNGYKGGAGVSVHTVEFHNQKRCEEAKAKVQQSDFAGYDYKLNLICVRK